MLPGKNRQQVANVLLVDEVSTTGEIGGFLSREVAAAVPGPSPAGVIPGPVGGEPAQAAGTAQANGELVPN